MAIVRSSKSKKNIALNTQSRLIAVRVLDIILDINHPRAEDYGNYDAIGTIFYAPLDDVIPDTAITNNSPHASPLFSHLKYYPLKNEIVLILTTNDKNIYQAKKRATYYLPQVNMWGHPHHNALPTISGLDETETSNDYQQTEAGLVRKVEDGGTDIILGQYFQEQINIKPLLPYEGDMILEGRFGNSIRFGSTNISPKISNPNGWSDSGKTGDPITIIRNGQSSNLDDKGWLPTTEKINDDASSIYLTSNQRMKDFIQSSPYMESWNAVYYKPQTIEQSLLEPDTPASRNLQVDSTTTTNTDTGTPLPPTNEDTYEAPLVDGSPIQEQSEMSEVVRNPKVVNESEETIEDQSITKGNDVSLPSTYVDPGSGNNEGGGVTKETESDGLASFSFFSEPNTSVSDQTDLEQYTP